MPDFSNVGAENPNPDLTLATAGVLLTEMSVQTQSVLYF